MGFRYRRSIGLGNGVRLNVSKRGFSSVSVGRPGSTLNIGRRGVRTTVGLPGTGLSYSTGGGSGAGAVVAVLGLIGAALGVLFWLIGAAARGSRSAQIALCGLAGLSLFAYLRTPEGEQKAPTSPASAMAWPVAAIVPPTPVAVAFAPPPRPVATLATSDAAMRTVTGANLRSGPSPQAKVVEQLPAGALVEVVGGEDRWAKVRLADGTATAWVAWSLLGKP